MTDTTLFLVRVWRQFTAFRASVRRVEDADTHLFKSADDMARYLEDTTTLPTETTGSRDDGTGCDTHGREEPQPEEPSSIRARCATYSPADLYEKEHSMSHRTLRLFAAAIVPAILATLGAAAGPVWAQKQTAIEQGAGAWRTHVLASGSELRLLHRRARPRHRWNWLNCEHWPTNALLLHSTRSFTGMRAHQDIAGTKSRCRRV